MALSVKTTTLQAQPLSTREDGPWRHRAPVYQLPMQPATGRAPARPKQPASVLQAESALANDVSSRFGRRLRAMRLSRSLTQADMARKFGIDRSFISELECGRKAVSLPVLEIIALGMQISLSELFEGL